MRVLFATTAGAGHFGPLVMFARACLDAGHEVLVAAPASFADAVAGAGFDHAPFADVPPEIMGAVFARLPGLAGHEADAIVVGEVFGRLDARAALPGVTATIESWRPDIVLREPCEFASLVAAERADVAQVQVAIGVGSLPAWAPAALEAPLNELRAEAGLGADPTLECLRTLTGFTSVPAGFDDEVGSAEADGRLWRFRDASLTARSGSLPGPWGSAADPLVYVTFGSVAGGHDHFASVYPEAVAALAGLPMRVLLTTGAGGDPAALRPWPDNVHVERWWPQADVMPLAAAVVGHGGFGTTMTALAAGVPQVVVPLFAFDQTVNGERVAAVGAGVHVGGGPPAVAGIGPAVTEVLSDPSYRWVAERLAAEIAALPDASTAVPVLESMAGA